MKIFPFLEGFEVSFRFEYFTREGNLLFHAWKSSKIAIQSIFPSNKLSPGGATVHLHIPHVQTIQPTDRIVHLRSIGGIDVRRLAAH